MDKLLKKYVDKIKKVNECRADKVMDSVWNEILMDFATDCMTYDGK